VASVILFYFLAGGQTFSLVLIHTYFHQLLWKLELKKWEFQARDRIESSACATDNGDRVFVGNDNITCNLVATA